MAVTQLEFFGALILGIAPALAVLWLSLRRFDRPHVTTALFDDRRVFSSLAVGLVFGVFASALNLLLPRRDLAASVLTLLGLLVLEELFKLVYLNRKSYQGRFDATFYGVPLGVGAAATAVVASVVWTATGFPIQPQALTVVVLFSLGLSLVNASSGAIIGFGASQGLMWPSLLRAVGVRYGHAAFLVPYLLDPFHPWSGLSILTALGFGAIVYRYVYANLLPGTLPEDLRRQLRRDRRRAQVTK